MGSGCFPCIVHHFLLPVKYVIVWSLKCAFAPLTPTHRYYIHSRSSFGTRAFNRTIHSPPSSTPPGRPCFSHRFQDSSQRMGRRRVHWRRR